MSRKLLERLMFGADEGRGGEGSGGEARRYRIEAYDPSNGGRLVGGLEVGPEAKQTVPAPRITIAVVDENEWEVHVCSLNLREAESYPILAGRL
jgi:hypothetical protein